MKNGTKQMNDVLCMSYEYPYTRLAVPHLSTQCTNIYIYMKYMYSIYSIYENVSFRYLSEI